MAASEAQEFGKLKAYFVDSKARPKFTVSNTSYITLSQ